MSKQATKRSARTKGPKTKLGFPDLDHSKAAVLDSLRSPESKRGYRHAVDEFIQWYCSELRLSFNRPASRRTTGIPASKRNATGVRHRQMPRMPGFAAAA